MELIPCLGPRGDNAGTCMAGQTLIVFELAVV